MFSNRSVSQIIISTIPAKEFVAAKSDAMSAKPRIMRIAMGVGSKK
jgi:hypothetical protein